MSFALASFRRSLPLVALRSLGRRIMLAAAGLFLAGACRLPAQAPGTQDTTFTSVETGFSFYAQLLEYINGTPVLFVGGDKSGLDELLPQSTATNSAGALYSGFANNGIGPDIGNGARIVYTAVPELPQPGVTTPKILVGGLFGRSITQAKNNQPGQNIFRFDPLGNVDTSFNRVGKGANNYVTSILPLADGGMVVAGEFDQFNQLDHLRIVRLDSTGGIAPASLFDPNLSFDATVLSLDAQLVDGVRNGQILVAGQFSNVNNQLFNKLTRLNADGSVDTSFHPSFDNRTTIVKSQPDGKILVGGDFENVSGTAAKHIVRLNYDGSVDPTFTAQVTVMPAGFANPPAVYVIQLLDDGSMYLGGNFAAVDGVTRNYLAKVDATGALDTTFDPGTTIINAVQSIVVQPDGRLLVGETVSRALPGGTIYPPSLIRLFGSPLEITLTTPKPNATEVTGKHGSFVLTRGANASSASGPLTVYLQLGGNAVAGKNHNYLPLPLTKADPTTGAVTGNGRARETGLYAVTFPTGVSSLKFSVIPSGNRLADIDIPRTVTLTVVSAPTGEAMYVAGQTATVDITN